ncbi:hypothetical protein ACF1G0_20090 [Streptomyces sp. NPDC013953]|uniref:hypothetical protein n=1 Tax=Streptomyces sp. NPDC013953 TaxID=3364868 RepID=UPI00370161A0
MQVMFVHGTGVRRERHERVFGRIRTRLVERFPQASVSSCFWGEEFGVPPGAGHRSVPGRDRTRGTGDEPEAVSPRDREAAEWALLLTDPLCELRLLAHLGGDADGIGVPGARPAGAAVLDLLAKLPEDPGPDDELGGLLRATDLHPHHADALRATLGSEEAALAAESAEDHPADRELAVALARAVVAAALASAGTGAECTGAERDRLVELITARLGGDARVPGGRVAAVLGKLALRVTTQPALNLWRGPLTRGATPFLGDILRYQARGAELREHLRRAIADEGRPAVVIGHSLGGVALVDLLASSAAQGRPVEGPRLLVTVGSQAPYLHELGALAGLAPGEPLPDGFPRWLNVYDRQDLLSFRAEPVFAGDPRVADHEVSSGQPFPPSHSAYWKIGDLYDRIADAVSEIE